MIIDGDDDDDDDDNDDDDDDDDDSNGDGDDDNAKVDHDKKDIVYNKDLFKDISVMQKVGAIDDSFCNVLQKTFKCTDNSDQIYK